MEKDDSLPLLLTQSQNQKHKIQFTFRPYRHWVPKPILTKNGFDSAPGDPNWG